MTTGLGIRAAAATAAIIAAGLLTGCGGDDTPVGSATPTTTTVVSVSVHPCEVFTNAMAAAGYRKMGPEDRAQPHPELGCGYAHRNPGYSPGIYSVGRPYSELVNDGRLVERENFTIAGHDASVGDASEVTDLCIISVDIPPGTLQIRVGYIPPHITPQPDDLTTMDQACAEAHKILDIITPVLPEHL